MNSLAPYLLFLLVALSAVGPARADGPAKSDAEQARAVSTMALPSLAAKLRARAEARATTPSEADEGDVFGSVGTGAPASVAANLPARP